MPEINTEFLLTLALEIQVSSLGETPYGNRRIFHFDGGSFEGPKLKGRVLPDGGGSSLIRRDKVLEVDVRLILETVDPQRPSQRYRELRQSHTRNVRQNRGLGWQGLSVHSCLRAGEGVRPKLPCCQISWIWPMTSLGSESIFATPATVSSS